MLPKHILAGQDLNKTDFRRQPVGNGPFKFDQWQSGDFVRVVKNPDYWDSGKPYLDAVVYRTIPNTQGLLAALERKEVQMRLAMNFADQDKAKSFQGFKVVATPSYSYFNFRNQCQMPITNEKLVRQALIYATDRDTICKTLLKGLVTPLHSLIMPTSWAYNKDVPKYPYDAEKAKALLDQAGWKLPAGGQVREKNGQKLSFEIVNIAGDIERLQIVQATQQMWAKVGVETSIKAIDAASFGPIMDSGYTNAYNFTGHDHEITNSQWIRKPNWPHFDNDRMYELINKSNATFDREERKQYLYELQNIWADEQPELPIFQRILFDAVANELQNFKQTAPGSATTWNVQEWWLKK
jgi:peptide/nickel transport system substrate-binding protein